MSSPIRSDFLSLILGRAEAPGGGPGGYQPGPSLEDVAGGATLGRGHSGDGVRLLQLALNLAGAEPPLDQDGLFGPKTEAALRSFQGRSGAGAGEPGACGAESLGVLLALLQNNNFQAPGAGAGPGGPGGPGGLGGAGNLSSWNRGPGGLKDSTPGPSGTTLRAPGLGASAPSGTVKAGTLQQLQELGQRSERGQDGKRTSGLVQAAYADYQSKLANGGETRLRAGADRQLQSVMQRLDAPVTVGGRETTRRALVDEIARKANVPPELVAGIWYREDDGMRTDRYLHNGEKLGRPTQLVPKGIYFGEGQFVEAAVHALNQKRATADALGLSYGSKDAAAMAAFAERYNGMGYRSKGRSSAYVTGGTEHYAGGMYVADHVYDARAWDRRLGVLPIVLAFQQA